MKEAISE